MLTALSRIENLVQRHMAGGRPDLVTAVNQLLALASETGQVRCSMAGQDTLRFEIPNESPIDLRLPLAKANLRSMCARLAKLRQESGEEFEPYGGSGRITRVVVEASHAAYLEWAKDRIAMPVNGADAEPPLPFLKDSWQVMYQNTMGEQEFVIRAQ